jgi:hypothetical protein
LTAIRRASSQLSPPAILLGLARRLALLYLRPLLDACFLVTGNAGQKLAYVYFEDEPGRDQRPSCSARATLELAVWPLDAHPVLGATWAGKHRAVAVLRAIEVRISGDFC